MSNNKGFVIPIVLVFMFISQLLYISLLNFNQIQSQRYQAFMTYYQQQIMLNSAKQLIAVEDQAQQISQSVHSTIVTQEQTILKKYSIQQQQAINPQLKIVLIKELNEEKILIIAHRLFIEQVKAETMILPDDYSIEGVILPNQQYQENELPAIRCQLDEILEEMKNMDWYENNRFRRNFQVKLNFIRPAITELDYNYGKVEITQQNSVTTLLLYNRNGQFVYKDQLEAENLNYLLETQWVILHKSQPGEEL